MPWKVDADLCTGCEVCCDTAPEVFAMDTENDVATCINDDAPENDEKANEAKDECPVEAITFAE